MSSEQPKSPEAEKKEALTNLFKKRSSPQRLFREEIESAQKENENLTCEDDKLNPNVFWVSMRNGAHPDRVELDETGRYIEIHSGERPKLETFEYDEEGYITRQGLIENAGQGWDRKFTYTTGPDGRKILSRLTVIRYDAAPREERDLKQVLPTDMSNTPTAMKRGAAIETQVVNFDSHGKPDNIIPLWVYGSQFRQ